MTTLHYCHSIITIQNEIISNELAIIKAIISQNIAILPN